MGMQRFALTECSHFILQAGITISLFRELKCTPQFHSCRNLIKRVAISPPVGRMLDYGDNSDEFSEGPSVDLSTNSSQGDDDEEPVLTDHSGLHPAGIEGGSASEW